MKKPVESKMYSDPMSWAAYKWLKSGDWCRVWGS